MIGLRAELERLEILIRDLDDRISSPEGMVREHLAGARSALLGSASEEYKLEIEMTREALPLIEAPTVRRRIQEFLDCAPASL